MSSLIQVIFFSLIGGIFSLIGGFLLISSRKRAMKLADYATPFAAGALLAAAFVDLLREAGHQGSIDTALVFTLVGILGFFFLERFLRWFHHHHEHDDKSADPTASLIIVGDTLHNFIDGIAIAAGFLVSPSTGIVVALAVAAHEIPQEIGDFGLLLKKGLSKRKVIQANVLSALAGTVAAVIFFQLGQNTDISLDIVLGLVAGFFIYVAVSDIIPSIHEGENKKLVGVQSALLLAGAVVVSLVTVNLHQYIDQDDGHDHGHSSHVEKSEYEGEHDEEHHAEEEGAEHAEEEHHDEGEHADEEHHDEEDDHSEDEHHEE